jgi:hypothetical protein
VKRQVAGLLLVVLGIALALVSGLATTLGIGVGGFGWKQIAGVVVGAALALMGAGLVLASGLTSARRL